MRARIAGMLLVAVCVIGLVGGRAALTAGGVETPELKPIDQTLAGNENFSTLCELLKAAGLEDILKGEKPCTLFAPGNKAFENLPVGTLDDLRKPENVEKLKSILLYHLLDGKMMSAEISKATTIATLNGAEINVSVEKEQILLNGEASITAADMDCANGVIHEINTVLMPPEKVAPPEDSVPQE